MVRYGFIFIRIRFVYCFLIGNLIAQLVPVAAYAGDRICCCCRRRRRRRRRHVTSCGGGGGTACEISMAMVFLLRLFSSVVQRRHKIVQMSMRDFQRPDL